MQSGQPSKTALGAASLRAAHQQFERGFIFADPFAKAILGADFPPFDPAVENTPERRKLRLFIAARSRYAEDAAREAAERGLSQMVILGAGLDTFAYRTPLGGKVRLFEVDHPATQAWKRERLAAAQIAAPPSLTFAPVDFEQGTLGEGLAAAGFDPTRRSFFSWLGVVPYLTPEAVQETLSFVGALAGGASLVFDYRALRGDDETETLAAANNLAARVAAAGEPFRSSFDSAVLREVLSGAGFTSVLDLTGPELVGRYLNLPPLGSGQSSGHLLHAATG